MSPGRRSEPRVIVTGPDPGAPLGGIAVAMPGYLDALRGEGLLDRHIPTYDPTRWDRHAAMAASKVPALLHAIREVRTAGHRPIVYAHAGAGLAIARATVLLRVARRAGAGTMLHLHSPTVEGIIDGRISRAALMRSLRKVDVVCALTPYWKRLLEQHHPGRVEVVPNPLPPEAEQIARNPLPPALHAELRILTMTRLAQGKGVDLAIRSMRHAPEHARLSVAGDGPQRAEYEELARSLGLADRVEFPGWVDGVAKQALLRRADVFLLPTTLDSFGMGFVESASYGLPAIGLRWGAIPDVVLDGETGWLVEPGDGAAERLAATLHEAADDRLRRERGEEARVQALRRFSCEAIGARLRQALPTP